MKRDNYRNVFFQIMHKDMASPVVVNNKPYTPQCFDNIFSGECFAQSAISTSFRMTSGLDFI